MMLIGYMTYILLIIYVPIYANVHTKINKVFVGIVIGSYSIGAIINGSLLPFYFHLVS